MYSLSGHVYKDVEIKLSIGCSVAWGCCCFRFIFIFFQGASSVRRFHGVFFGGGVEALVIGMTQQCLNSLKKRLLRPENVAL